MSLYIQGIFFCFFLASHHLSKIIMRYVYQRVPLQSIVLNTTWNLHPWALDKIPSSLGESFASMAIIHPPIVLEETTEKDNVFVNLCGYRRLQYAMATAEDANVDCLVLPENTSTELLLNIILEDQKLSAGELSLAEKARFLQIALQHMNKEAVYSIFLEKLNLKKRNTVLEELRILLKQDKKIIEEVHKGNLQIQMLGEILRLTDAGDRLSLIELFQTLHLGTGKQKRIFQLIRDVAYRNQLTFTDFLAGEDIVQIIENPGLNVPQKIQHLSEFLQQQLQPKSLMAEKQFQEQVKSLHLPKNKTVSHSTSFEKDEVTLSIVFDNFSQCKDYLAGN